jgi:hypothetical protein
MVIIAWRVSGCGVLDGLPKGEKVNGDWDRVLHQSAASPRQMVLIENQISECFAHDEYSSLF